MIMLRSFLAGLLLIGLVSGSLAQVPPRSIGSQSAAPLILNLGAPYEGAACGATYRPDWNLDLDRVVGFAESQLSACDLALTLAAIEGHVASAGTAIAAAQAENWKAWMAAEAFLPKVEDTAAGDPVIEGRRTRVRAGQDKIQSARNGLRFLAKLAAVIQFPPAPALDPGPDAIAAAPLALPEEASEQGPAQGLEQGPDQGSTPEEPTTEAQGLVACVTRTAWVIAARPAQDRPQRVIDDPAAGEALSWLKSRSDAGASAGTVHAFAVCPGTAPLPVSAAAPLPGSAQGLTPAISETPSSPTENGQASDNWQPLENGSTSPVAPSAEQD